MSEISNNSNSMEENNINNNEYKQTSNLENSNLFPIFFNPKKYNIMQKKKEELSNSLLFNKNYKSNVLDIEKENNNDNSKENLFQEKKDLVLPRIPSANSIKVNSTIENKQNIKKNYSSSQNKEKSKNKYLPPRPKTISNINIINKDKNINYNTEFIKLKKENEYMITELERLNIELRTLIDKQMPLINSSNSKKKYKKEKSLDINKENEKKANRKYLHTLITEYNRIYKNLTIGQDRNIINNLEKKLTDLKKSNSESKKTNKILKNQIYTNEQNLKREEKNREKKLENLTDFEKKYILYKTKLAEINKENERMNKLLIDEEKKIDELKISYVKLEEILSYYEETEESIKKKSDEKIKNKELEMKLRHLIKKKEILMHARLTMEKTYNNKIDKQKKYINELNQNLDELNKEIKKIN